MGFILNRNQHKNVQKLENNINILKLIIKTDKLALSNVIKNKEITSSLDELWKEMDKDTLGGEHREHHSIEWECRAEKKIQQLQINKIDFNGGECGVRRSRSMEELAMGNQINIDAILNYLLFI